MPISISSRVQGRGIDHALPDVPPIVRWHVEGRPGRGGPYRVAAFVVVKGEATSPRSNGTVAKPGAAEQPERAGERFDDPEGDGNAGDRFFVWDVRGIPLSELTSGFDCFLSREARTVVPWCLEGSGRWSATRRVGATLVVGIADEPSPGSATVPDPLASPGPYADVFRTVGGWSQDDFLELAVFDAVRRDRRWTGTREVARERSLRGCGRDGGHAEADGPPTTRTWMRFLGPQRRSRPCDGEAPNRTRGPAQHSHTRRSERPDRVTSRVRDAHAFFESDIKPDRVSIRRSERIAPRDPLSEL